MVSNIRLFVNYASRTVEKKTEFWIYDIIVLVASLGGTLGLLLGYSLQSILVSRINSIEGFMLNRVATRDDGALDGTIETIESAATTTPEQGSSGATPLNPSQSPMPDQRSSGATPLTPSQINNATRPEWPPMVPF